MPDSVFTRSLSLASGLRVRLRLARPGDAPEVERLLARRGVAASPLDVRRLLSFDPARRAVLCAFAPLDGESLVGLGAIALRHGADPDTLVVDESVAGGLGELLGEVLHRRAASHARRAA
jgi:hypothetical protein